MEAGRRRRRIRRWTDDNVDPTDEPNRKRTKFSVNQNRTLAEDRFSALPESLILRILSLLPIRELITTTTTLSKKFHPLWTHVPNLTFNPVYSNHISFVTKTLALRHGSKIENLSLVCGEYVNASVIDQWIGFAIACNVESLTLYMSPWPDDDSDDYTLPEKIYTSSSLRKLDLLWLNVEPVGEIRLKSLTQLCIRGCDYSNDKMSQILAACPVLEFLEIDCRDVLDRLVLASKSVRKIRVCGGWEATLPLLCMPLLVDAYLDFSIEHGDEARCRVMRKLSWEVIDSLRGVEKLTLTTWFIQVLSMWRVEASPLQLVNCRYLTLETGIEEWEFPGIATLLHIVPNLEKLDLKFEYVQRYCNSCKFHGNDVELRERFTKCSFDHLKIVTIYISNPKLYEFDLQLIQLVLKKAKVLEKMIICPRLKYCNSELLSSSISNKLLRATTKLLSFPRSSPSAVVTFMCKDSDFT